MLGVRAMSHDESLHALYAYYLYANGNYDHNPMMHGPFRYHVTALMYFLFGDSDFTARLAPALIGVALIGDDLCCCAATWGAPARWRRRVMVTIGPSLLFHSRYIRDDIFMAFFTVVWIYGVFRYVDARRLRYLVIMVAGMALWLCHDGECISSTAPSSARSSRSGRCGRWLGPRWLGADRRAVGWLAAPFWWVLHEMKQDFWGLIALGVLALVTLASMVISLRGRWQSAPQPPRR
jgi:hypothetical protein